MNDKAVILNRAYESLEKNKAVIGPGQEDLVEGVIFEKGLWSQIQFCKRKGGGRAEY